MIVRNAVLSSIVGCWLIVALGTSHAQGANLDKKILESAKKILEDAREHNYATLGVLKFKVQGQDLPAFNAGTMNTTLARRLELALVIKQNNDQEVVIINDANSTALKLRGANHFDPEKRGVFFTAEYNPHWGTKKKVKAAAFLTGEVEVDKDFKKMTVKIKCFDEKNRWEIVDQFEADFSSADFIELGRSFARGDVVPGRSVGEILNDKPWVRLKIYYGKKNMPIRMEENQGEVDEPTEADGDVKFILERTKEAGNRRFAVVLKVNGLNTLYSEEFKAAESCSKWIVGVDQESFTIQGFQADDKHRNNFKLASDDEFKTMELTSKTGTIEMVVFQEQKGVSEELSAEQMLMRSRGVPIGLPMTLDQARTRIKSGANQGRGRGVIMAGKKDQFEVEPQVFHHDPQPIMSVVIRYYKAKR